MDHFISKSKDKKLVDKVKVLVKAASKLQTDMFDILNDKESWEAEQKK